MTDDRLERRLEALGRSAFPEAPSLVDGVVASIARRPEPRRRLVAAVAVAAIVVAAVVALPATREAVARLLGIGGVDIEQVDVYDLPEAAATAEPLGQAVALEDVAGLVRFTPLLPEIAGLSNPTIFVRTDVADGLVSLVYRNEGEGPGLIITQFRTAGGVALKQVAGDATFREVTVVGEVRGIWIEGAHPIAFLGTDGSIREDSARLVGNTLLWEADGFTFRIESALSPEEALTISRSMIERAG